jgi:predicted membrane protein
MENRKMIFKNLIIVVIILGVVGLLGNLQEKINNKPSKNPTSNLTDKIEIFTVMGHSKKIVKNPEFERGDIANVMGGSDITFETPALNQDANLDLFVLMGGVKIFVPKNWEVEENITSIMGGTNDKKEGKIEKNAKGKLVLSGLTIMGGVEIIRY